MSVIKRLQTAYRQAKVPPSGVEKASRHERLRRNVWMIASTFAGMILGLGVLFLIFTPLDWLGIWEPSGDLGVGVVFAVWVVSTALIDLYVFSWAVSHFNLVPPWQFRVETGGRE